MIDDDRALVAKRVPRGTMELLDQYVELLNLEAAHQNLIAASTLNTLWRRHVLDSLQLLDLANDGGTMWVDVGSGAGLPGLVIAIASDRRLTLIEPRRLRAEFLGRVVQSLGLEARVAIHAQRCETVVLEAATGMLSARAVAPLDKLLAMAAHLADAETRWLLPKGASAAAEVAAARRTWQGDFRLVPSLTDSTAHIVVARQIRRRGEQ